MESDDDKIVKALERVFSHLGQTIPVIFKLKGHILPSGNKSGGFQISKSMTEGAFGKIFSGSHVGPDEMENKNIADKKRTIVIKFTQSHEINDREYDAHMSILKHLRENCDKRTLAGFAQVYCKGKVVVLDSKLCTLGN